MVSGRDMREARNGAHGDNEHNHAQHVQELERAVETLPHPVKRKDKDKISSKKGNKAGEMHRLRELLRNRERRCGGACCK